MCPTSVIYIFLFGAKWGNFFDVSDITPLQSKLYPCIFTPGRGMFEVGNQEFILEMLKKTFIEKDIKNQLFIIVKFFKWSLLPDHKSLLNLK